MSEEENVKVAVRMRPFNSREKARDATIIVDMKGATTLISNPEAPNEDPKSFTFDFSYWSHDGCKDDGTGYWAKDPSHPNSSKFADQRTVYNDLGQGVLNNAWEGFNSTLFAYGQTGSGKSYSMVGYGVNKGIIPIFCDELFIGIDKKKAEGVAAEYEVTFSMLEIYNEQVRDLLNPSNKKGGLRVRQHPQKGFYAENLKFDPVGSYKDIENKIEEGTMNRTVAATNMNATSSRAHTIVGIQFVQKAKNAAGEETAKTAIVNLVDLAGSERAESTGATGDRLKEGAAINQSLSSLGNVISALADQSNGKKVKVPYRDSTLTKLLKNALGGNSKTIMIAAVSPADINYDESLSTLRYADRAKQIKTKATVNEDPTEKLIRNLQEENEKLKKMLESGGLQLSDIDANDTEGMSEAEKEAFRKEIEDDLRASMCTNDHEKEEMMKNFEEKLRQARAEAANNGIDAANEKKKTVAHISNLNYDPMLSGKVVQFIEGQKTIGNNKGQASDIIMMGPSIQEQHAQFTTEGDKYFIEKLSPAAKVLANGDPVTEKMEVHHNDRLMFGTTQLYTFCNPKERDASKEKYEEYTFEMAQEEIAASSGFDMQKGNKSKEDMLIQEDLIEILPAVEEANSISEELDKKKKFEVVLVSPEARGELGGRMHIFVKMTDLETEHNWMWSKEKFINRKYVMQEMFENYTDGEDWKLEDSRDPFTEDADADCHIGSVKVWLQSLAYRIEMQEQLEITDYKGQEVGHLNLEIVPCSAKGKDYAEKDDMWVDNPDELLGKELNFNVKIESARGLPSRFTDAYAKYKVYLDDDYSDTKKIPNTSNPDWKFKKQHSFKPVTEQLVSYLQESAIMIQIWGKQKQPKAKKSVTNTKDALAKQAMSKGTAAVGNVNTKLVDANKVRFSMQLAVMKKRAEKSEAKVAQFRELVKLAEEYKKPRISTKLIKDLLAAPTKDAADKCLKMVPKEKGAEKSKKKKVKRRPKSSESSSSSSSSSSSDSDETNEKKASPSHSHKPAPIPSGQKKTTNAPTYGPYPPNQMGVSHPPNQMGVSHASPMVMQQRMPVHILPHGHQRPVNQFVLVTQAHNKQYGEASGSGGSQSKTCVLL